MKKVVVTLCIGHEKLGTITHPRQKAYAEKIGADFTIINKRTYPNVNICFEKYQIGQLLDVYDRVIYFDTDVVVRDKTPNLFDIVPFGSFGGKDEEQENGTILQQWDQWYIPSGWHNRKKKFFILNGGVMILDKTHKILFNKPGIVDRPYWDQPWWSYQLQVRNMPVTFLPDKFNRCFPGCGEKLCRDAFIIHCMGFNMKEFEKIKWAKSAIEIWNKTDKINKLFVKTQDDRISHRYKL